MGFKSVQNFLRSHMIWIVSVIVFFCGTLVLTRYSSIFISPDETAAAFFVRTFYQFFHTGSFRVYDAMNDVYGNVLHPRSIVTDWSVLLPGSFFGLIFLYGLLTTILGSWSLTFLTPVIVVVAVLAWNQLLCRWFSKRVAFVSSLLFLFHPAIWYYTARGLMPNVLFVCCAVFSAWFFLLQPIKKSAWNFLFAGLFLGLALFVRLSEAYWIVPLFAFLLVVERKSFSFKRFAWILFGVLIPMCLLLWLNFKTYGNPFTFGYSFVSASQTPIAVTAQQAVSEERLSWLLPFGFHPRGIFWHTLDYLFLLFWWLTIPTLCAIPLMLRNQKHKVYLIVTIIIAFWLCVWYGSWQLNDNPDPTQITIANSYVRYWLPIFVMSTPLVATSVLWLSDRFKSKKTVLHVSFSILLILFALNVRVVFLSGQDALVHVVSILEQSLQIRERVFQIVPDDGVIITDRSDKLFFPTRHVIVPLRADRTYAVMPEFVDKASLYYYGITLPASDVVYLDQQKLAPLGLHIEFVQSFGIESLYQIKRP